jgi:outer membrane protein assembly factor BamB
MAVSDAAIALSDQQVLDVLSPGGAWLWGAGRARADPQVRLVGDLLLATNVTDDGAVGPAEALHAVDGSRAWRFGSAWNSFSFAGPALTLVHNPYTGLTALSTTDGAAQWTACCKGYTSDPIAVGATFAGYACHQPAGEPRPYTCTVVGRRFSDGEMAWSRPFTGYPSGFYNTLLMPATGVFLLRNFANETGPQQDLIAALDPADGHTMWQVSLARPPGSCPSQVDNTGWHYAPDGQPSVAFPGWATGTSAKKCGTSVVLPGVAEAAGSRTLTALDPATGAVAWTRELAAPPAVLKSTASAVYAFLGDGTLEAMAAATGGTLWTVALGQDRCTPGSTPMALGNDVLYVACRQKLFAVATT